MLISLICFLLFTQATAAPDFPILEHLLSDDHISSIDVQKQLKPSMSAPISSLNTRRYFNSFGASPKVVFKSPNTNTFKQSANNNVRSSILGQAFRSYAPVSSNCGSRCQSFNPCPTTSSCGQWRAPASFGNGQFPTNQFPTNQFPNTQFPNNQFSNNQFNNQFPNNQFNNNQNNQFPNLPDNQFSNFPNQMRSFKSYPNNNMQTNNFGNNFNTNQGNFNNNQNSNFPPNQQNLNFPGHKDLNFPGQNGFNNNKNSQSSIPVPVIAVPDPVIYQGKVIHPSAQIPQPSSNSNGFGMNNMNNNGFPNSFDNNFGNKQTFGNNFGNKQTFGNNFGNNGFGK